MDVAGEEHGPNAGQPEVIRAIFRKVKVAIGSELTTTQKTAAELMALVLEPSQVDTILDLPLGTADAWVRIEKFTDYVADRRWFHEKYDMASVDVGRALTPGSGQLREHSRSIA